MVSVPDEMSTPGMTNLESASDGKMMAVPSTSRSRCTTPNRVTQIVTAEAGSNSLYIAGSSDGLGFVSPSSYVSNLMQTPPQGYYQAASLPESWDASQDTSVELPALAPIAVTEDPMEFWKRQQLLVLVWLAVGVLTLVAMIRLLGPVSFITLVVFTGVLSAALGIAGCVMYFVARYPHTSGRQLELLVKGARSTGWVAKYLGILVVTVIDMVCFGAMIKSTHDPDKGRYIASAFVIIVVVTLTAGTHAVLSHLVYKKSAHMQRLLAGSTPGVLHLA